MPLFIDTHAHIYDSTFNDNISEIIERSIETGTSKIVMPAIDSSHHINMMNLAQKFKEILYPCIGLHPTSVNRDYNKELDFVKEQLVKQKFTAIGEIGIDGYWSKEFLNEQTICFKKQIELAIENNLPIIIHSRNATQEIFDVLSEFKGCNLKGVFHAYSGSIETYVRAKKMFDLKFGIGGVVTYKNSNLAEVVKEIQLEDIVLETDSPWLTPVPFRGKINDPSKIEIIAKKVSEIKELSLDITALKTTENATKLFVL